MQPVSNQNEPWAQVEWHDAEAIGIEGKGWTDTLLPFDRLPGRALGLVPEKVWELSRQSAGLCVRFATGANEIWARWTLAREPAFEGRGTRIANSGLDLYAQEGGRYFWLAAADAAEFPTVTVRFCENLDPAGMRRFCCYLPLRNGVEKLWIGVPRGERLEPIPPGPERPIVYYGTSIVHGAHASRPGMTHAAQLGRRLDRPVINLGFSGVGRMEPALAELIAGIHASVFILDCLPNMGADLVQERAEPFVRRLRQAWPQTPIILVEDREWTHTRFFEARRKHHAANRAALRQAYENLVATKVPALFYLGHADLLGDDGEASNDGSHPTDLGFWRYANALEPVLREALRVGG